jgi:hypothetical protein
MEIMAVGKNVRNQITVQQTGVSGRIGVSPDTYSDVQIRADGPITITIARAIIRLRRPLLPFPGVPPRAVSRLLSVLGCLPFVRRGLGIAGLFAPPSVLFRQRRGLVERGGRADQHGVQVERARARPRPRRLGVRHSS